MKITANQTPGFYRLIFQSALILFIGNYAWAQKPAYTVSSPDNKIKVEVVIADKQAYYTVNLSGSPVLQRSKLGLIREDEDFSKGLTLTSASGVSLVKDNYEILKGKRQNCTYEGNQKTFVFKNANGKAIEVIFSVSNDGVAFRYHFSKEAGATDIKKIKEEITSFHFLPQTKAWLQPMSDAKTGWSSVHPSYEEYYLKGIDAGTPSPFKAGWVYPALFNSGTTWLLITEAALDRNYCGTRLKQDSPGNEYTVGFPQVPEVFPGGALNPESVLPWYTPWRIITIGSLKTIAESTLGTDLAIPAPITDVSYVKPGKASWSWPLLKDDSIVYNVQKKFIDYASDMRWEYCLIDVNWDWKIGYDKIKELAGYAKTKNVSLILWYNSSGDWNTTGYTPKSQLLTHADREKAFARLKEMGIKGMKVDFFGGDGQSMIQYYLDILDDAAKYNLLVNFHGSTYPRGWHRTYPNLMTMEAIKGFEFATFEQQFEDEQPQHCAMLPFTRNAFDPMDYTPMCLYKIPNIERKTTNAFELALSVLFLSGIQHYAETPDGMSHVPDYVKSFLRDIPGYWEDTKFIDGYPGKLAIIARKSAKGWYVTGINGENIEKTLEIDLSFIGNGKTGDLITDGKEKMTFDTQKITITPGKKNTVTLKGNGGFVIKF